MRLFNSKRPELDWPDTVNDENGNYQNTCLSCKESYIGRKHSFNYWNCYSESKRKWDGLTPEQQENLMIKNIDEWNKSKNIEMKEGKFISTNEVIMGIII